MGDYRSGAGYASRPGLNARAPLFGAPPPQQDQVALDLGGELDLDAELEDLAAGVSRLKQVSTAIGEESALTSQIMEGLESAMETARATVRQTVRRLDRVARKSRSHHVALVFLFAVLLFIAVYAWTRVAGFLRWVGVLS